jgi:hypothetical protein
MRGLSYKSHIPLTPVRESGNTTKKGDPMKSFWYLPIAAVVGATSLTVWGQANAGPPPEVSPGVVVTADVTPGSSAAKTEDPVVLLPTPTPTASITAIPEHAVPEHAVPETQLVPAEPQTYAPLQATSPIHDQFDDKGGLRDSAVSDDPPGDDKGGLREAGVSDDGVLHDLGDDKGGLREAGASDDGPTHDLGDDKGGLREDKVSDDGPGDDKGGKR